MNVRQVWPIRYRAVQVWFSKKRRMILTKEWSPMSKNFYKMLKNHSFLIWHPWYKWVNRSTKKDLPRESFLTQHILKDLSIWTWKTISKTKSSKIFCPVRITSPPLVEKQANLSTSKLSSLSTWKLKRKVPHLLVMLIGLFSIRTW